MEDRAAFLAALDDGRVDIILPATRSAYDGLSALAEARKRAPEIPFLFVSGALGEERAAETLKAGATDFVLKQHLARLVPAFRRALQRKGRPSRPPRGRGLRREHVSLHRGDDLGMDLGGGRELHPHLQQPRGEARSSGTTPPR